jgi:hypothetical protein
VKEIVVLMGVLVVVLNLMMSSGELIAIEINY